MSNPTVPIYTANVDANGLFVTAPKYGSDGGDSLANNASAAVTALFLNHKKLPQLSVGTEAGVDTLAGLFKISPWVKANKLFGADTGIWVRNPDPTKWYSNPDTTSRDQILPAMLAMGLNKEYKNLARTQFNIIKRGFFAQNIYTNGDSGVKQGRKLPDTFLGHLHLFIRCWGRFAIPLYPLLFVLDFFLLVSALVNVFGSENKDPNNCDDRNGINCHIAAIYSCPTPISYLSRKIYAKYRPPTYASYTGNTAWFQASQRDIEPNHVMGALVLYFWENNPIIAEAYRPIIERYFT